MLSRISACGCMPSDLYHWGVSTHLKAQLTWPGKMRDGLIYIKVVSHLPCWCGKQSGLMNVTHVPFSVPWGGEGVGFYFPYTRIRCSAVMTCFCKPTHLWLLELSKRSKTRQWIPWRMPASVLAQHLSATTLQSEKEWRTIYGRPQCGLCFLHFAGQLEGPGKLTYTKEMERGETRRDRQRQDGSKGCKKPEVLEGFFWFSTLGDKDWCRLGTKEKRKLIPRKLCSFVYTHRESTSRLHTNLPRRSPITVVHLTAQPPSTCSPTFVLPVLETKAARCLVQSDILWKTKQNEKTQPPKPLCF